MEKKKTLDIVVKTKVKPILSSAMQRFLGITVPEISTDISDKLIKSPVLDIEIDTTKTFKQAKEEFKRQFLIRLLQNNFGNVSKVAEIAKTDRRSIHRMIKKFNLNPEKFRKDMMRMDYIKQEAVKDIIESTLDDYSDSVNEEKLKKLYQNIPKLSKNIIKELPESPITLKQAELQFEKKYLLKALAQNNFNIAKTARQIKLRYETLHRKIKALSI